MHGAGRCSRDHARGRTHGHACAACQQLLYLYQFYYPPLYPQTAMRCVQGAVAALHMEDLRAAAELARRGRVILQVSHGDRHELTRRAAQTVTPGSRLQDSGDA